MIEVDGAQYYSDKVKPKGPEGEVKERSIASPTKYGEMTAADRDLKLDGYELFRVGGKEHHSAPQAQALVDDFFDRLLATPGGKEHHSAPQAQALVDDFFDRLLATPS